MPHHVQIVSLEGLLGCGKSTQLGILKLWFRNDSRIKFVDEPVDEWDAIGLLEAMYTGELEKGTFQLTALLSRMAAIIEAVNSEADVIVTERSWLSDGFVFARANLSGIHLEAYQYSFSKLQSALERMVTLDVTMLYLRCSADDAMTRIRTRARDSEATVPIAYLDTLYRRHELMIELCMKNALGRQCRRDLDALSRPARMTTRGVIIDSTQDVTVISQAIAARIEMALARASRTPPKDAIECSEEATPMPAVPASTLA